MVMLNRNETHIDKSSGNNSYAMQMIHSHAARLGSCVCVCVRVWIFFPGKEVTKATQWDGRWKVSKINIAPRLHDDVPCMTPIASWLYRRDCRKRWKYWWMKRLRWYDNVPRIGRSNQVVYVCGWCNVVQGVLIFWKNPSGIFGIFLR